MRVYFFVEARWAVENIRKQRLKVSRFFNLNDPFELLAGRQIDKAFRKKLRFWVGKLNKQYGLLCFTESKRNTVMWSHYGDRHKGMCLGFDVDDGILKRIDYSNRRLRLAEWKGVNPPEKVRQALLKTKFDRWGYEKEQRMILPLKDLTEEGDLFFKDFDHTLTLVEVIAGHRCCVKWKPLIRSAVNALPVKPKLIKARLAFRRFEVVTQQLGFDSDTWQECSCSNPEHHDQLDSTT